MQHRGHGHEEKRGGGKRGGRAARPPLFTVWEEFCGWTFDRTAGIPKSQRFTFGQKLDAMSMEVLLLITKCIYSREKIPLLEEINLMLEQLRVLWRMVQKRLWISLSQLDFAQSKLDEAGRMVGGWLRQCREGRSV